MTNDRILTIVDLLLGAAHADKRLDGTEQDAVRRLVGELLGGAKPTAEVESRIRAFSPAGFDLAAAAKAFAVDPPIQRRKLLELVAQVHEADGELHFDEDEYLVGLARALGVPEAEYKDLSLEVEIEDLRTSFERLRPPPLPTVKPAPGEVDVDVDLDV